MEIRILRYFLTVVREGSISHAAEVLHITQPTLSRQLSQLEYEVGVTLFHRGSRKIILTSEGLLLKRRAEEILSLIDKTEKELIEQDHLIEGQITIGSGEVATVQILSKIIADFHKKYPLVHFDLLTATADHVKDQMEKGLIDIGILLEPIDMDKFDFIRLKEKERWVVLMKPDDPLAALECIQAKDLKGRPLILPRRMNVQNELRHWFGKDLEESQILFTSNLRTNGAIMVEEGLGYSLVIEGSLGLWNQNKITYRPLEPPLSSNCAIAWKKQQPLNLATTKFLEHIKCFLGIGDI